jgi:urease accessory protein
LTLALGAVPAYLRSHGRLSLAFERRAAATVLRRRQEGGCLRVRVPRGRTTEAVVINTSGGLCGGDTIAQDVVWGQGTAAVLTTQAAEKIYGSQGPASTIGTRLTVVAGARGEWLPQETILFDGARLERDTCIDMEDGAALLWCETVVFGRLARGESFSSGMLRDRVRVRRGARLVYADVLDLGAAPAARLERAALGDGARASAVILSIGGDIQAGLEGLRGELDGHSGVLAAASAWNGIVSVRMLSADPAALRLCLAAALGSLRGSAELPRVWRC